MADEDKKKKSTKLDAGNYKDKAAALKAALSKIKQDYGDEACNLFSEFPHTEVQAFSTGSIGLDTALGVGGYPRGRIVEIIGPEMSGKTTMTLHAIAECQKAGGVCAFIDAEHALDANYATALGVDMDALIFSQPSSGEEALGIAETLISAGAVDMVVIDSVAALVPQAERDADMGAQLPGLQARLMSQALRKLTSLVSETKTVLFFINQIRLKIGVMFGNPETTPGGNALKFYASQRLDIRRVSLLKDGDEAMGGRTRVKIIKNKLAPPFKELEFDVVFGKGINYVGELIDIGVEKGFVEKSGAWYSLQGERIGQGRDNAVETVSKDPKMIEWLDTEIRKANGLKPKSVPTE